MTVLTNKWIEKESKRGKKTGPAYDPYNHDPMPDFVPYNPNKPVKRFTKVARANLVRTLRGVRK